MRLQQTPQDQACFSLPSCFVACDVEREVGLPPGERRKEGLSSQGPQQLAGGHVGVDVLAQGLAGAQPVTPWKTWTRPSVPSLSALKQSRPP